jgi:hypothetical protein
MDDPSSEMTIGTVGAIILGWLLGLLSPAIVGAVQRHYRQREIRNGIICELAELRFRMAATVWIFESRFGTYDRSMLNCLLSVLETYKGATDATHLLAIIKKQAAFDDKMLLELAAHQKAKPGGGLNVKKYRVPYLDANIGQLGIFEEESRAAILDIRAQLELFNEEVDEARLNLRMTFEITNRENHSAVVQNVETCYKNLGQKAKQIADRIGTVLSKR